MSFVYCACYVHQEIRAARVAEIRAHAAALTAAAESAAAEAAAQPAIAPGPDTLDIIDCPEGVDDEDTLCVGDFSLLLILHDSFLEHPCCSHTHICL